MPSRPSPNTANLTAVGDVHRWWRGADAAYLERTRPDLTLFVGDLGDEDPDIVGRIADLPIEKVVMLGNHDAWQSFSKGRGTDRLHESLARLGEDHLAYAVREVPAAGLSVIGARPFSWGGQSLRSPELYDEIYGIRTMRQSAAAIVDAARNAQHRDLLILAHNGPYGLGSEPSDIYGKDFGKPGGDWGDYDLALAMQRIESYGLRIRAVVAGHMHHRLVHPRGAERRRFVQRGDIKFLNTAYVPRIVRNDDGEELSYFVRMSWQAGDCTAVEEVWVDAHGNERIVQPARFEMIDEAVPILDEVDE